MKSKLNRRYGWVAQRPDIRDHWIMVSKPIPLPSSVDLRPGCPPVYDQGELGSCTANAICGAIEYDLKKVNKDFIPSRLFVYYNERVLEHTVNSDSGAQLRDGIKAVAKCGVPPETEWPYSDKNPGPFETKPTLKVYEDATKHKVTSYQAIQQALSPLQTCLASGYPFVFGITVYESFESDEVAKTGAVPMPSPSEQCLGGHAICAVGYNNQNHTFIVRNSWGTEWGIRGYFTLPYAYVTEANLSSDFWKIQAVVA
jgi:C1A family cysteine protease